MTDRVRRERGWCAAGRVGLVLGLFALQGCDSKEAEGARGGSPQAPPVLQHVEGELLVRFREKDSPSAMSATSAAWGAKVVHGYTSLPGLRVVRLPPGTDLERALAAYRLDPGVLYAGYNSIYSSNSDVPNDPEFERLWSLRNTGQSGGLTGADIQAAGAWGVTTGSSDVVLATIDSGIDYTHPDLAANVWTNPAELPGNGIDDDRNGYIDDVHGINAIGTGSGDPMDDGNHGTHVAGILGAVGGNNLGVTGVNWKVKILACKFLDSAGNGVESDALKCLDYFLGLKTRAHHPVNIVATNNSWSCRTRSCNSPAMRDAIARHMTAGMLFVAAAGNVNANIDVAESWPARHDLPNILAVAATDRKDARWGLSSFGPQTVALGAPGVEILSTVPGGLYRAFSGTSMASPHVTGVAGLLAAQDPTRDWKAIKNLLLAGGQAVPSLANVTLTGRRLRAWGPQGSGALNCDRQLLTRRLKPLLSSSRLTLVVGGSLPVAVLNIHCAAPGGEVVVTVAGRGPAVLRLVDDGAGDDQAAGDGIYTARFIPEDAGSYALGFPGGETVFVDVLRPYLSVNERPSTYEVMTEDAVRLDDAGDETVSVIGPLPFPLRFADVQPGFTTLHVDSNGRIGFAPGLSLAANSALPAPFFSSAILPLWQNLEVPSHLPSGLFYEVLGEAPHRKLVIEWRDALYAGVSFSTPLTFQVVFLEGSSDIAFNYANVILGSDEYPEIDNGGAATVGIQTAPSAALQFSHLAPSLSNGTSLVFRTSSPHPPHRPVVSAPVLVSALPREDSPITLQASFRDDGQQTGAWTVAWDCHHDGATFKPEVEQSVGAPGSVSTTCVYSEGGRYGVAVRVTGQDGISSEVLSTVFSVGDVTPGSLSSGSDPPRESESCAAMPWSAIPLQGLMLLLLTGLLRGNRSGMRP
ncbi:S8 family peptidase [Corallococcus sp. bb12-1]|uniref:S8 family peptidase n=1 Tax=Corallococcus sp. bb12-1 TaxID=2996784 RepID=UPI0022712ED2|nr:S8 family peptidase [Corallococcus sp. bb12-1]MCY1046849.1 S8 family peptidase [Corallococcus sp. bb12-1]